MQRTNILIVILFFISLPDLLANEDKTFIKGEIKDENSLALEGVNVVVENQNKNTFSIFSGEYFLSGITTGEVQITFSYLGYGSKTVSLNVEKGENTLDITLEKENISLEPVVVSSPKRETQILDVPIAISSIGNSQIENVNINYLSQLSEYVPGLYIREQGVNRPSFVIRGLTSNDVSPGAQPRVAVYLNNAPINRVSSAAISIFDMERVETLKGPQNNIFGRGGEIGGVHFITKKPVNKFESNISVGAGNYDSKELQGMVNIPLVTNKLFVRLAGNYQYNDGYVKNTFGENLNGLESTAGRVSVRFLPAENHRIDLIANYQKDDSPGIAFMSKQFPNANGGLNLFDYTASLEQGNDLGTGKDLFDISLNYKYYINADNYFTYIGSYRQHDASASWDGDGTAAQAIYMSEATTASQIYQELRYNFSVNSKLSGFFGGSYWSEKVEQTYWFSPNEQHMVHLFLDPSYMILPDGTPLAMPALPNSPLLGPLAGMPLTTNHEEKQFSDAENSAVELFFDTRYQITNKLFFSAGIRGIFDMLELNTSAKMTGGDPSTLGMFTGNYPNLFFKEIDNVSTSKNVSGLTWRVGFNHKPNKNINIFTNYSRGRRPDVLQFNSNGEEDIIGPETVDNIDIGIKSVLFKNLYLDATAFFQKYAGFQTNAWVADPSTGNFKYEVKDGGKATSYGLESSIHYGINRNIKLYGNYTWLNSEFDDKDEDGLKQEYAGNSFKLSPKHSFSVGFMSNYDITEGINVFLTPSYYYKTKMFFEDANTEGLEQDAYGIMNLNTGVYLKNQGLTFSFYVTNILNEEYVTSAGNTGSLFGVPTFVPGAPMIFGAKLKWQFNPNAV